MSEEQPELTDFTGDDREEDGDQTTEWETRTLSDVIEINDYPSLEKGEEHTHVGMKHLKEDKRRIQKTHQKEYTYSCPRFKNGDTLFARITPCLENGKTAYVDVLDEEEAAFGSTEFIVMSATDETLPKFVYYTARRPEVRQYAIKRMTGTSGRQRVPTDVFDNFELELPPTDEQERIVRVLDSLDTKIETNNRINELLEEIAQALFESWFVEFKGHKNFRDTEIGEIPTEYEIKELGEVADLMRGYSYTSEYIEEDSGYPMINLKNISEGGGFDKTGAKYYSEEDVKERYELDRHGLVTAITEQTLDGELIGSPAIVPDIFDAGKVIISQDVCGVEPQRDTSLTKYYLYHLMKSKRFRNYAESHASGTTVYHLSLDSINKYLLPVPKPSEIERFSEIARWTKELQSSLLSENGKLAELRDTLLPKLMSGEIRLDPDSNNEPTVNDQTA